MTPISIHGGGTLARPLFLKSRSTGRSRWHNPFLGSKRLVAFVIDVVIVVSILNLATRGMIANALNISYGFLGFHYAVAFAAFFSPPTGFTGD